MKRVLSLFLSCIFVLGVCFSTPIVASAAENPVSTEGFEYEIVDLEANTCKIVGYANTEATSINIPESIKIGEGDDATIEVASVSGAAFEDCTNLEYVFFSGAEALWNGTFEKNIPVHTGSCNVESLTYTVNAANATIYEVCGCGENRGRITLVATEDVTYGDEVSAITVEKTGKLEKVENSAEGYTLSYTENESDYNTTAPTDAGSYTAKLTYEEQTITKPFTIAQKTLTAENVALTVSEGTYTGLAQLIGITVKDGETPLTEADYTITYKRQNGDVREETSDLTSVGTIFVEVAGKGNYTGIVTKEYVINKAELTITIEEPQQLYVGNDFNNLNWISTGLKETDEIKSISFEHIGDEFSEEGEFELSYESAVIENEAGNDVTKNYNVSCNSVTVNIVECAHDEIEEGKAATCQNKAVCKTCGEEFGEKEPHNWEFTADGAKITATCQNDGCGKITDITLTPSEAPFEYDGKVKENPVEFSYAEDLDEATKAELEEILETKTFVYTYPTEDETVKNAGEYTASITLDDDETTATLSFEITAKPLTDNDVTITGLESSYVYTGSAIEPSVVVKDGNDILVKDRDYTVEYSDNTEVSTEGNPATVTITFKGNYSGEVTKTFEIVAHKHLWSYEANEETDTITATCNGEGNCGVGNQTATITLKLKENSDWVYNKTEKKFAFVEGSIDGVTLPEIVYSGDCINAGDYTASITLLGEDGKEAKVTVPFAIEKATPTLTAPTAKTGLVYDGEEQELVENGTTTGGTMQYKLGEDGQWNENIPKAVNAGTYTVYYKVTGNENYNDVVESSVEVTIAPKTITATLTQDSGVYNESAHEPTVKIDDLCESESLVKDTDYTVNYANNTNVGSATVTVKLCDTSTAKNYTFANNAKTTTLNYTITKGVASINETPIANELTYTGTEQELVTAGSATGGTIYYTLTPTDENSWSVDVPTATKAGTYKVFYKVIGNENYDGIDYSESNFVEVTISPKQVSSVAVYVAEGGYTYTGTAFEPAVTVKINGEDTALVNTEYEVKYTNNKNAGTATVTVTLTDNYISAGAEATSVIASKNFTIAKATPTASYFTFTKPESLNYDGKPKVATIDCGADIGDVTVKYYSGETLLNNAPVEPGTYTVKLQVKENNNYNSATLENEAWTFTIIACEHKWENGVCKICNTECEHEFGSPEITKNPTCNAPGELTWVCVVCKYSKITTVNPNGDGKAHDWSGDYIVTKAATCVSEGVETKTCKNGCGEKTTRQIAIDTEAHVMGEWVTTEQTCVADGKKVRSCTLGCGATETEVIKADNKSHKLPDEWTVTKEANCVEDGEKIKACLNEGCTYVAKESIPADGKSHNLGEWEVTIPAKCTVKGEVTQYCQNGDCTHKVTASLKPDGKNHDFAEDFTVIEPTCILKGSKFKVCENEGCKEVTEKTEIAINPDAHKNIVTVNAKDATCEEKGYTGDKFCNDCKKTVDPGIEINAKGHTESDWIVDKEATFTEEGARHTACTVCNKELKKEVVAKLTLATPSPKAYNKTGCIKVKWADVDNALTYNVYRSEYVNKKWTTWKRIASNVKQGVGYYNDKNVTEGKQYKYTVKAYNGDFVSGKKASNKLIFISPVKPSLTTTTTGIILKWNTVLGADKYIAYRSQIVDGKWSDWKKVATITDGKSSWVDTTAESGVTYKYSVRVYKGSSYSNRDASNSIIFLTQPTLKLSNTSTGIKGSWKTVNGATGYVITRAEYNDSLKKYGPTVKIGTASSTAKSFTDKTAKAGVKYKYTITAINGSYSSIVSSAKSYRRLAQPTVTIENTNGAIKGSWTQVTGAASYIIYRSEVVNGKWSSWKNLGTAGATAKSFTDKTVKSGVKYKYRVIAKNGGSKSSAEASNKLVYLACPKATVSNSIYGAKVKWNVITGAESYIVYRKSYVNKQWTAWQQIATTSTNSYTDSTAVSGAKYRYTIHAVNDGSLSARKDSASFVYVEAPKTTTTVTAKAITLNWNEIGGAKKYVVYRAELGSDGKWSGWTKVASLKDINTFADTTVVAGKTYKYKVNAYIGKSKSSSNATDGVLVPKAQ